MSDKRDRKRRRREKRQRKSAEWQAGRDRAGRQPAKCGGACRPDDAGSSVVIDGARVVNRGDLPATVAVTVQCPGGQGRPACTRTLDTVRVPARGFIDFAAYSALPLLVHGTFDSPGYVLDALQGSDEFVAADEQPSPGEPWQIAEVAGVKYTAEYIHNANPHSVKVVAVCRCENGAGYARCGMFKGVLPPRHLGDVQFMADGAAVALIVSDAERQAEAAACRVAFEADVAAGKMTAAEAADLIAFDDKPDDWIDPETVQLVAVLPFDASRRRVREVYDRHYRDAAAAG